MRFRDKTAIITGAASGMGLLCGQMLADEGANVVLTDVNAEAVAAAAEGIRAKGGSAIGLVVDVTDYAQIEKAANAAIVMGMTVAGMVTIKELTNASAILSLVSTST